jgi:hypothetical protein
MSDGLSRHLPEEPDMTTFATAPATTLDAALAELNRVGAQAHTEAEDGYPEMPATVEAVARAFDAAERAGATEEAANTAYQRGYDWGEE